jgi:hypothetical protein
MQKFTQSRDFFGWQSRLQTREQAGRGQSTIGDQKNVFAEPAPLALASMGIE